MTDHPEPAGPPIVLVIDDPVVQGRIEAVARDLSAIVIPCRDVASCRELPGPPRAFVVDVTLPGALVAMKGWKTAWPEVPLVGVVRLPDPALWSEAEAAGADLILTHGTAHRRLPAFLEEYTARPPARRLRAGPVKDFDGRLGFVATVPAGPDEEIALYHVGYELYAVGDACPHAGARLSEGDLNGPVVTCPRHGSQFDVTNGERLRGPADFPLRSYPVIIEGGIVYVEVGDRH